MIPSATQIYLASRLALSIANCDIGETVSYLVENVLKLVVIDVISRTCMHYSPHGCIEVAQAIAHQTKYITERLPINKLFLCAKCPIVVQVFYG